MRYEIGVELFEILVDLGYEIGADFCENDRGGGVAVAVAVLGYEMCVDLLAMIDSVLLLLLLLCWVTK